MLLFTEQYGFVETKESRRPRMDVDCRHTKPILNETPGTFPLRHDDNDTTTVVMSWCSLLGGWAATLVGRNRTNDWNRHSKLEPRRSYGRTRRGED